MVQIAVDPFWTLALALLVDAALGRPSWLRGPIGAVRGFALSVVDGFDRRLNRPNRGDRDLRIRGAVAYAILAGAVLFLGFVLDSWFAGSVLKALLVATFLAQRLAFDEARAMLGRRPDGVDRHALARGAAAGAARRFADDVVGPALAYAAFGLAGLFAYALTLAMADRLTPTDPTKAAFGRPANLVASACRIASGYASALLIALAAAFSPGGRPGGALAAFGASGAMTKDGRPALPVAAIGGALALSFEGRDGWIGDGKARQDGQDLRRVLYLFVVACLLHLTIWAALGLLTAR